MSFGQEKKERETVQERCLLFLSLRCGQTFLHTTTDKLKKNEFFVTLDSLERFPALHKLFYQGEKHDGSRHLSLKKAERLSRKTYSKQGLFTFLP